MWALILFTFWWMPQSSDAGCNATPEEIKLVKNIIKQIKENERTKGFCWKSYDK